MDILTAFILLIFLFALLASGVWIGLSLIAVAWIGMELFTSRPAGDSMMLTIWGSTTSWTLTALPLFLWMGEIMFRSKLSEEMFKGISPWLNFLPGKLLYTNVIGCTIFAAISGSSAATCMTIGKINLSELLKRHYPESMVVGTLAGAATLGLLIPPSIMLIVYGVAANVSIARLFLAGVVPGLFLAGLFCLYIFIWALLNPQKIPQSEKGGSFIQKCYESRRLIPSISLIVLVLGAIYSGVATPTESAALGVLGALLLSACDKTLTWKSFKEGLFSSCFAYCMIGLILAGASFLTLAMGFIGLPRHLAEFIGTLGLSQFQLILLLTLFYLVLGCFLDGISMVVLTIAVLLPTIEAAGIDLIWFGVFIVIVVELAQITPPVGFNLFVLQGLTQRQITWIARASLPLFMIMLFSLLIFFFVPELVLWLPSRM